MTRVLLDANVFLHAIGSDAVLRPACRRVLSMVEAGELVGEASALIVDEIVHVRNRRLGDRQQAVADGTAAAALCLLHPVAQEDVEAAMGLFVEAPRLQMRDAIHAAVARRYGLSVVLSRDRGFDGIPGLRRVDPADVEAIAALVAGSG
ncbi:MAG: type II toxin-antitoxin system VapC family toxin [Geodermatophilaceae bacterium]|nr:type II toxin-antitoxin system VapC family toxin [Geodermatophilaceae bacterium]